MALTRRRREASLGNRPATAARLAVEVFTGVGGAQTMALRLGLAKDGEAFRQVFFQPCRQSGGAGAVIGDGLPQAAFGFGQGGDVEDAAIGAQRR